MAVLEAFHPWLELWAAGAVEAGEVEARVDYDVSLCLLAASTKGARTRLEADLIESQRRLRAAVPAVGKAAVDGSSGARTQRRAGART